MGKRQQQRLETREGIFEAALARFELHGYDDTTVEDICEAAGVGRATFFRHFETKAGLLREHNRRLALDAAKRIADDGGPGFRRQVELVADAIHASWIHSSAGLRSLGIDAASLSDPGGQRSHPELLAVVCDVVRHGIAEDDLRTRLPIPLVAHIVVFHLAATTVWWMGHPHLDLRALLDDALDQCVRGLAPDS